MNSVAETLCNRVHARFGIHISQGAMVRCPVMKLMNPSRVRMEDGGVPSLVSMHEKVIFDRPCDVVIRNAVFIFPTFLF